MTAEPIVRSYVHRRLCVCHHAPEDHFLSVQTGHDSCRIDRCDCPRYQKHQCDGGLIGEVNPL